MKKTNLLQILGGLGLILVGIWLGKTLFPHAPTPDPHEALFEKIEAYANGAISKNDSLLFFQAKLKDFKVQCLDAGISLDRYDDVDRRLHERVQLTNTMRLIECVYMKKGCKAEDTDQAKLQAGVKIISFLQSEYLNNSQRQELKQWWTNIQNTKPEAQPAAPQKNKKEDINDRDSSKKEVETKAKENAKIKARNKEIKTDFETYRTYIYGSLDKTKYLKNYANKLEKNKQKFIDAGVNQKRVALTTALAKNRVKIKYYRFEVLCFLEKINCSQNTKETITVDSFKGKLSFLKELAGDENQVLTLKQRQELALWLKASGLIK